MSPTRGSVTCVTRFADAGLKNESNAGPKRTNSPLRDSDEVRTARSALDARAQYDQRSAKLKYEAMTARNGCARASRSEVIFKAPGAMLSIDTGLAERRAFAMRQRETRPLLGIFNTRTCTLKRKPLFRGEYEWRQKNAPDQSSHKWAVPRGAVRGRNDCDFDLDPTLSNRLHVVPRSAQPEMCVH
jgi:hypothetical protein